MNPSAKNVTMAVSIWLSLTGCNADVDGAGSPAQDGGAFADGGCLADGGACDPSDSDTAGADSLATSSRFARLTHTQWQNSLQDLFAGIDLPNFSDSFRSDPVERGFLFDNDSNSMAVDETLRQAYQRAANEVAALVVADPEYVETLAPQANSAAERAQAFVETFGKRVHRRPLTDEQIEDYLALYEQGRELFPELDAFEAGIRLLLQAFLQSPHFLYRVESGSNAGGEAIPLDGHEVASRVSYALWNTMPDDRLFEAAQDDELLDSGQVAEHAGRMLESERAAPVLAAFHHQLFEVERYQGIARQELATLPQLAEREHELFVRHVVFERDGSFSDLLTSNETFVDSTLAELYGLSGDYGDEFELVELDDSQRSGFLTQIGFLASNANSGVPDPIHRGVFLARRLGCIEVPLPPGEVPPLPDPEDRTNRETVEAHTEAPGTVCQGCHAALINPFGFPFEYYDGLGRYRTEDNDRPVDGEASPLLDGEAVPVDDALGLVHALSESEQVHTCYARHLLEFVFGRRSSTHDDSLIGRASTLSLQEDAAIKALIVDLVSSRAFLTRPDGGT